MVAVGDGILRRVIDEAEVILKSFITRAKV